MKDKELKKSWWTQKDWNEATSVEKGVRKRLTLILVANGLYHTISVYREIFAPSFIFAPFAHVISRQI